MLNNSIVYRSQRVDKVMLKQNRSGQILPRSMSTAHYLSPYVFVHIVVYFR